MDNSEPFSASFMSGLSKATDQTKSSMERTLNIFDQTMKQQESKAKEHTKKVAVNSAESMDNFCKTSEKSANDLGKKYEDTFNKMFGVVSKGAKQTQSDWEKSFDAMLSQTEKDVDRLLLNLEKMETVRKHSSQTINTPISGPVGALGPSGGGFLSFPLPPGLPHKSVGNTPGEMAQLLTEFTANRGKEALDVFKGLSEHVIQMIPHIAAISSLSAALYAIFDAFTKVNETKHMWAKEAGGDLALADAFVNRLEEIVVRTHLTHKNMYVLAQAFQEVGMKALEGAHGVDDFIILSADMKRLLEISDGALASYMRSLSDHNKTAGEARMIYDGLYQAMQLNNLTISDLNSALSEGNELWKQYGFLGGKGLNDVQADIVSMKGLFKALNLDIAETKQALTGIFGDPKMQRRQAAFLSQMSGMSGAEAYNMLLLDPAKAQEKLAIAGMKFMSSNPISKFGMGIDQLKNLPANEQMAALMAQQHSAQYLKQSFGLNQLPGLMNNYLGFLKSHPGGTPEEWMQFRKERNMNEHAGTMDNAIKTFDSSFQERMSQIGQVISSLIHRIANKVDNIYTAISGGVGDTNVATEKLYKHGAPVAPFALGGAFFGGKFGADLGEKMFSTPEKAKELGKGGIGGHTVTGVEMSPSSQIYSLSNGFDIKALNKYRKAQGMKPFRENWHPHMFQNAAITMEEALKHGADPATAIALMLQESGGNEKAAGDFGYFTLSKKGRKIFHPDNPDRPSNKASHYTSFGLGQLHSNGMGAGMTEAELLNPRTNITRSIKGLASVSANHPEYSAGMVAARSQRPANEGAYAQSINSLMPLAHEIVKILKEQTQHIAEDKEIKKKAIADASKMALVAPHIDKQQQRIHGNGM